MKKMIFLGVLLLSHMVQAAVREPVKGGKIIAEWDLAFPDQESLDNYFATARNKLIVNKKGLNAFDVWDAKLRKKLTYCVSDKFANRKKDVIEALKVATQDWMDVANVKFIYLATEDAKCSASNTKVVFDVNPVNFGQYLARAFFPSSKRADRNLMIDASSFKYSFVSLSGFLRHELGHVLGFRHEHISASGNQKCLEDGNFIPVTVYDQLSVMHYPQCGGKNDIKDMILSMLDKEGVAKVYP
jgi:hypothetical protein